MKIVHLDFETRSRADLPEVGAYRYACDPSTRILIAAVSGEYDEIHTWVHPEVAKADPVENKAAVDLLVAADLIYVHNVGFEAAMIWGRGQEDMGISIPLEKWRCTAAIARRAGLPSSLEKVAEALKLQQLKDGTGKRLIRKFSIPQSDGTFTPCEGDDWDKFQAYCRQDVRTEKAVHERLRAFELQGDSLATFLFDLRLNERGIPVNVGALRNAQRIVSTVNEDVSKEFVALTGINPTQRAKVLAQVQALGVRLLNLQAETLQSLDISGIDPKAARILSLYSKLSFAAVKKVQTMLDCACPDGRVRGGHLYYGAGTGRWSGRLIQPQNFKKAPVWMKKLTDPAYASITGGTSAEGIDAIFGDPVEVVSGVIRHFIHDANNPMLDADYNAIEARIIAWLAKQDDVVTMWRDGQDLYRHMAAKIHNCDPATIDSETRAFGKVVVLACGYGMGPVKFQSTCEAWGIECDQELAERAVKSYRSTHPNIVKYWYALDDWARKAIAAPNTRQGPFFVRRVAGMEYLFCKLPSGRSLAYPDPKVELQIGDDRTQITYWGALPSTVTWGRVKLYGGKLAENITQACAADIMAHGAINAEANGYEPFMLVHDQALCLRISEDQTPDGYAAALTKLPAWAEGLPLKAEAKLAPYYRK